ncbi:MAG: formate/nitrite transporter family protein [Thermoflexales bacterium]|nr:formate/nitrite transporter family protein [Thermoflexales bacterium]
MSSELFGFDAYSPKEIAERVETVGVTKARLPPMRTFTLGMLAGGFVGLGGMAATMIKSDASLSPAVAQLLSGLLFSIGLILIVIAGAELFTGNNLLVMAWADRKISTGEFMRNLGLVLLSNLIGSVGLAVLVFLARHAELNGGALGETYVKIAAAKVSLPFDVAFFRAILCNVLVCLAVWMAFAGRSVIDKIAAIVFPITVFVMAGYEHSVANMYVIPLGWLLQTFGGYGHGAAAITLGGFISNLIPVVLGNFVGGAVFVGLVYHVVYRRNRAA